MLLLFALFSPIYSQSPMLSFVDPLMYSSLIQLANCPDISSSYPCNYPATPSTGEITWNCTAGSFCIGPNPNNAFACTPGFYCPPNAAQPTFCPERFYCSNDTKQISICPKNYFCPLGKFLQ